MSAIVGIFHRTGEPCNQADLHDMMGRLGHRGPDGAGSRIRSSVGLGQLMLRTTPEADAEHLPLVDDPSGLTLVADARIDNREELVEALGIGASEGRTTSDGRLILRAYEKWGEAAPEKLIGDYAFAIWDERRRSLFCARDSSGVRAFYYFLSEKLFAFATEIKALTALKACPRRLNETRVADYLNQYFEDETSTFYEGILRLRAAHSILVDGGGATLRRFWSLDPKRELRLKSDEDYAEAFRQQFNQSIRARIRAPLPLASFLSGGLDSSSITSAAARLLGDGQSTLLHSFSATFPNLPAAELPRSDERPFAQAVVAKAKPTAHFIEADRISPLDDLDRYLDQMDEPCLAPNQYIHRAIYAAAERVGARVILDGIDGDATVSHGLELLADLALHGRWLRLNAEAKALSKISLAAYSHRKVLWHYGFKPILPRWMQDGIEKLRGIAPATVEADRLLNPDFARRADIAERIRLAENPKEDGLQNPREKHIKGLTMPLYPYLLEVADRTAAPFSIEPRYPFFDRRLMEFCVSLPVDQKLRNGWTRSILRRGMEGILPPEVQWRTHKSDLSPNFILQLSSAESARIESLLTDSKAVEPYVHMGMIRDAYKSFRVSPRAHVREGFAVFGVLILAKWLEKTRLD